MGEGAKVWAVIRVDDHSDGEHTGVRQHLKLDSHIPAIPNPDRNGCADLVPAKCYRLSGAADMRHKGVESVLVLHVEAVTPKPCEKPEHPTEDRNRCGTSCCRLVGAYR